MLEIRWWSRFTFCAYALFSSAYASVSYADAPRPYVLIDSFSYSEPFAIKSVFNELDDSFDGGDLMYTHNQIEIGLRSSSWQLGAFYRYDYYLAFNPDTAEIAFLSENSRGVELGRDYALELDASHIAASGIHLKYFAKQWRGISLSAGLNILNAEAFIDGTLVGNAAIRTDGNYSGALNIDYFYSEDELFDRPVDKPRGTGFAIDVDAHWQAGAEWAVSLQIKDALSSIYWREAPYTQLTAAVGASPLDANGFINTSPAFSGIEGERGFRQVLPVRSALSINWKPEGRYSVSMGLLGVKRLLIPSVKFGWQPFGGVEFFTRYYFKADAIGVGIRTKSYELALSSDRIDISQANAISLRLRLGKAQ